MGYNGRGGSSYGGNNRRGRGKNHGFSGKKKKQDPIITRETVTTTERDWLRKDPKTTTTQTEKIYADDKVKKYSCESKQDGECDVGAKILNIGAKTAIENKTNIELSKKQKKKTKNIDVV